MAQARGRATVAAATVLLLVVVQCGVSSAATFKVGDEGGWVFGVQDWPNGKTFKDGDILGENFFLLFFFIIEIFIHILLNK